HHRARTVARRAVRRPASVRPGARRRRPVQGATRRQCDAGSGEARGRFGEGDSNPVGTQCGRPGDPDRHVDLGFVRSRATAIGGSVTGSNASPVIVLDKLTKIFVTDEVETHALAEVTLQIERGEYVSISGPSGCGKSTLLSILGLLDAPSAGTYQLDGQ